MTKIHKKTCSICAAEFVGFVRSKYCDKCRDTAYLIGKNKQRHLRLGRHLEVCTVCKKEFWTSNQTICMPCRSTAYRVQKQEERARANAKRAALIAREIAQADEAQAKTRDARPPEPRPKTARGRPGNAPIYRPSGRIPAACSACAYCEPREDFETGMVCRAEMMLRCRPYRPDAQPLVRRQP